MPRFSVIIPNYNHAAWLEERIESVLNQTFTDFELILLDDCSTDNSREIIEKYRQHPKVSHISYAEQNSGSPFRQWQKGLSLAGGDWIWIAESDDRSEPVFLATAAAAITANPATGLFYSDAWLEENKGADRLAIRFSAEKNAYFSTQKWSTAYTNDGKQEIAECLGLRCTINNASSAVIRKDLLKEVAEQAATFNFHGDWFCYLAVLARSGVVYDPSPLNHCRIHSSGIQSRLPEDGRHRAECFQVLDFQYRNAEIRPTKQRIASFARLNLDIGLLSGRKEWRSYFRINKKLAWKVLLAIIRKRLTKSPGNKP